MSKTKVTRTINAPLPFVFSTIADIHNFLKAVPNFVKFMELMEGKPLLNWKSREILRTIIYGLFRTATALFGIHYPRFMKEKLNRINPNDDNQRIQFFSTFMNPW